MKRRLKVYQLAAGLSDAGTGLLLLSVPTWTLATLRLHAAPQPMVFLRFIGAFVLGVGLSYLWELARNSAPSTWTGQWRATAIIRACVALFLLMAVARHALETGWMFTAAFDAALAALQCVGLSRGWLERA